MSGMNLDSELWVCLACGREFIGRRMPADVCSGCTVLRITCPEWRRREIGSL